MYKAHSNLARIFALLDDYSDFKSITQHTIERTQPDGQAVIPMDVHIVTAENI